MKLFLRSLSYVFVAVITCCCTVMVMQPTPEPPSKLEELQAVIEECFIGEADPVAMGDAAADAMVDSLGDRWSYYIPASRYNAYKEQMNNAYVGIGITITAREDNLGLNITEVNPGGSAAEAGIRPGDILSAVNGRSTAELGIDGTSEVIRGEVGTTVEITVLRDEEELIFPVERREIRVTVATGTMLEGNIGLVTISNFDSRCYQETVAAIESMLEQGATSLLFDVRNNPGGYKSELVDVLDYLLPEGPLFRSLYYTGKETVDSSDADCLELPMAVLVNGSSYSAAEFFAAAIREYEAGFVVGTQTSGKGYFQNTMQLSDGSAVGLSVGKYFTPDGVCLADVGGLTPDVVVEVDQDTEAVIRAGLLAPENDPQIQAAVEKLLAQNGR